MSEPDPQASVLGNLPSRRPSVRSPRREEPREPEAADPVDPGERRAESSEPDELGLPGLEGLARSGFAVAGGLAALGVRVAEEAVAAVRGAIDRR